MYGEPGISRGISMNALYLLLGLLAASLYYRLAMRRMSDKYERRITVYRIRLKKLAERRGK
jgi:hypothetical protein